MKQAVLLLLACCAALLVDAAPLMSEQQRMVELNRFLATLPDEHSRDIAGKFLRATLANPSDVSCSDLKDCHDPDCGKNVTQLITSKGYPCEDHLALTSDGYQLAMQRIAHGKNMTRSDPTKSPVLLQHGLLDASHTWVINQPYQSLGFILADAGYEVWLGNNRGNTYSDSNINYSTSDHQFWEFSWDEMAFIDLPTQIDYVLNQTGQSQLFYVGHSEGTTQAFSGFTDASVAAKVKLFVALAPVAYIGHLSSVGLPLLAELHVDTFLEIIGWPTFLQNTCALDDILDSTCNIDNSKICQIGMCALMGCNPTNINASRYDIYVSLDPAGTSTQNMNHWGQMFRKDNFCKYDYIRNEENRKHYGQRTAPCYDLSQMAAPVALFYGGRDDMADPTDVAQLLGELNPAMIAFSTEIADYSHIDFIWGMDAYQDIYAPMLGLFGDYQ